eukprot:1161153-Pelagomonas_calceolata.AAC.1
MIAGFAREAVLVCLSILMIDIDHGQLKQQGTVSSLQSVQVPGKEEKEFRRRGDRKSMMQSQDLSCSVGPTIWGIACLHSHYGHANDMHIGAIGAVWGGGVGMPFNLMQVASTSRPLDHFPKKRKSASQEAACIQGLISTLITKIKHGLSSEWRGCTVPRPWLQPSGCQPAPLWCNLDSVITMVTIGGDLQPGCLADRLVAGLSQPKKSHKFIQKIKA